MSENNQNPQPADNRFAAFVIGGTGGVGAHLVNKLINSPFYSRVTVISRRELTPSPKLNVVVWDNFTDGLLDHPEKAIEIFKNHHVGFCCLGASERAMMGLIFNPKKYGKVFRTVDYEYVVGTASAAHCAGVSYFSVISSPTADPKARFLYSRIKGEMEHALQDIDFRGLSIFQPYHLMKVAAESDSYMKQVGKNLLAFIARIIPAKQKAIWVEEVAEAMKMEFEQRMAKQGEKVAFYQSDVMIKLAGRRS